MGIELLPQLDVASFPGLMGMNPGADMEAARQTQIANQQAAQDRAKAIAQQQAATAALHASLTDPSPAHYAAALALNPNLLQQLKAGHEALDADQQTRSLNDHAAVFGNLQVANNTALSPAARATGLANAKAALQQRLDADKAAGKDTTEEAAAIAELDQPGGPEAVQGMLGMKLQAVLDKDKAAQLLGAATEARQQAAQPSEIALREAQAAQAQHEANKPTIIKDSAGGEHIVVPNDPNAPAQTSAAPQAVPATPAPTGGVYDQIGAAAAQKGATPAEQARLRRLAQIESGGRATARNGSSTGYLQFHGPTFDAALGRKGNINDLGDQVEAGLNLGRQDTVSLQHAGVAPTDANLYVMHQQGAGGGLALLTAPPEVGAVAAVTPTYRSPHTALAAIAGNIGLPYKTPAQRAKADALAEKMTAGQFVNMWQSKWSGQKPGQAAQTPTAPDQQPGGYHSVYDAPDSGGEAGISDSAAAIAAGIYIKTGQLPTRLSSADKTKIMNSVGETADRLHLTADDILGNTSDTKALTRAVGQQTVLTSQLQTSEQTLNKNIDVMLNIAKQGGVGGSLPVFNRWIQAGRQGVAGDPQVTALNNAVDAVASESAALMTRTTGTGGSTTDSALAEGQKRFPKAGTVDQLVAAANIARTDGHNRVQSNVDTLEGLRNRLRGGAPATAPLVPPPPAPAANAPAYGRVGTQDGLPVYTREQALAASKVPGNSGKHFYLQGVSGNQVFH